MLHERLHEMKYKIEFLTQIKEDLSRIPLTRRLEIWEAREHLKVHI